MSNLTFNFDPADSSATGPTPEQTEKMRMIAQREKANKLALSLAKYYSNCPVKIGPNVRRDMKKFTGTGGIISSQDSGGQYLTPYSVTQLITYLNNIQTGAKILDPTAGTARFAENLPDGATFTGIEIDPDAALIAKTLYPHHEIECADIRENLHFRESFDYILGNPPFGLWWKVDPQKSNICSAAGKVVSQWKVLEAAVTAVKRGGVISFVVPTNSYTNDRACDTRAIRWWNSNCIVRAEISLPSKTFVESGTSWPCSILIIQRYPAPIAQPFIYNFKNIDNEMECLSCINLFRESAAYKAMKEGEGNLLRDRSHRHREAKINTAHVEAKKEFEIVYSGPLQEKTDEDIIYVKRSGGKLHLKPNGVVAALKLEKWKSDVGGGYSKTAWEKYCTVSNLVLRDNIKLFKYAGLKLEMDPDLKNFLRGQRKFYKKENLPMKDIPTVLRPRFEKNMEALKTLGIWDKLFPYQRNDAALHALKNYSYLGYIQGLGKTRTGIATVMLKQTKTNLFVCFSRLTKVWYDEMILMGIPAHEINVIKSAKDLDTITKYNIISLETLREEDRGSDDIECERCGAIVKGKICTAPNPDYKSYSGENKTCGWNRYKDATCPKCAPTGPEQCPTCNSKNYHDRICNDCGADFSYTGRYCRKCGYSLTSWKPGIYKRMNKLFTCIVVDESQSGKNRNSLQGKATRTLKAKHKMILTGTILDNYVSEAFWQLWWLLGKGGPRFPYPFNGGHTMFLKRFCEFTKTKSGRTKIKPAIQNEGIFYQMMDSIMTRRTEEDPQVKEVINLPKIKGDEPYRIRLKPTDPEMELYNRAVDNFEEWYKEQLSELDELPYWMRGDSNKKLSAAVLVKLNALRKLSSCPFLFDSYNGNGTAKMNFIKGVIEEKLAQGKKVLVSSTYKALVNKLIEDVPNCEGFTGDMTIPKRNKIMHRFQTEEYPKVLAVSTECCNLGVTLTAASTAILSDMLWSPKKMEQMWKRIHRIGQTEEAEVIYLINEGMIDEDINELVIGKDKAINKAIDRISDDTEVEYFSPLDFANKMLAGRGKKWVKKYMGKESD